MKSRSEIWLCALEELGAQCSVDTRRDAETLTSRVAQEGDTFLKVALPSYAKDLELSLAAGRIPWEAFRGFARKRFTVTYGSDEFSSGQRVIHSGGAPKFLGNFMDLVFTSAAWVDAALDTDDGANGMVDAITRVPVLRRDGDVLRSADAIAAMRQLCLMFGKEKERCSPSRVDAAVDAFIETDKELDLPL